MDSLDHSLLAQYAAIDVSTWSDALDQLQLPGVLQGMSQRSGQGRMLGFAVTARQTPGALGDFDKADFAVGRLVEATGPGRILMVDVGGMPISTMGGLAALACSQRQAAGVVIDGACRDLAQIQATGLWLASRWVAPTTGKGRLRLQPMGQPIVMGQVRVCSGDLVVGDDSGLVVIARTHLAQVFARAQAIAQVDDALEQRLRQGQDFVSACQATGYMPPLEPTP